MSAPAGRRAPLYPVLTEPLLWFGGERNLVALNLVLAVAFVAGAGLWFLIPLFAGIHLWLVYLGRHEPCAREIYLRYARQGDVYDPWPHSDSRAPRPFGFGRGEPWC
ncbi:type IV secretory pathway VirB3 family protein [mine drainage metagenome]|uniref:Type IV secretory pathway VirB3 family protein n=1 Tax=mine drainage metagenome TaxID=410659 RepID=T1C3W0_9ZZZZ